MKPTYRTSDIYQAAALLTLGYEIDWVDKTERKAVFVFWDSEELREDVKRYNARKIVLIPQDLFYSMKTLKTQLYDEN